MAGRRPGFVKEFIGIWGRMRPIATAMRSGFLWTWEFPSQVVFQIQDEVSWSAARRPRFDPDPAQAERLTDAFLQACSTGDLNGLVRILAFDAVLYSDGGGKVAAVLAPIRGADRIARFFVGILKKMPADLEVRRVRVNGQPGFMTFHGGQIHHVMTIDVIEGRIGACFIVSNPDKLKCVGIA